MGTHTEAVLSRILGEEGFGPDEPVIKKLASHLDLLLKWNRAMNLTGLKSLEEIVRDLVLDSFHLAAFLKTLPLPQNPCTYDLGAGSGFPGIPLRTLWQDGTYHLVERGAKRAIFLRTVLASISLPKTHVQEESVELIIRKAAGSADLLVAKAFMPWKKLLEMAGPLLADNGHIVLMLAEDIEEQIPRPFKPFATHSYSVRGKKRILRSLVRCNA
ncbi:MAG: 16S rRNA (guanine(527)-N(7))-methyltransferase RsmG [Desulfovibrio sp.]|nr:16S rRNA (guanine(527)-N(7))-methyltransferase RsmG [Desulfovibrio sp.]